MHELVWSKALDAHVLAAAEEGCEWVKPWKPPDPAAVAEQLRGAIRALFRNIGLSRTPPRHGGYRWLESGVRRVFELIAREIAVVGPAGPEMSLHLRADARQQDWGLVRDHGWLSYVAGAIAVNDISPVPALASGLDIHDPYPDGWSGLRHISPFQWLVTHTGDLEALGVPRDEVKKLRTKHTGRPRPVSAKWLRAVGLWGRVGGLNDVKKAVGADSKQVNSYRQKGELTTHGSYGPRRSQAHLSFLAGSVSRDARSLGVTEFERIRYEERWYVLERALAPWESDEELTWDRIRKDAEALWHALDLRLAAPPELLT